MVDKIPTTTVNITTSDKMRQGQNYKINKKIWELIEESKNNGTDLEERLLALEESDIKEKMGYDNIPEGESLMSQIIELQEALEEETHVTAIFHTESQEAVNNIEESGFWFDYEGIDAETGNFIGTRIMPNGDGDYIVENVEIGTTHIVRPPLYDTLNDLDYKKNEYTSEFYIDKDNHEFYSLRDSEPQVTTQ